MSKRKFLKNEKHVFWEALLMTIVVFSIGVIIGVYFENQRAERIEALYLESELHLFDLRIENELFDFEDLDCDYVIEKNIEFGDKIFEEAVLLKKLEKPEDLTEVLRIQHKKYDILRALFWMNSIKINKRCMADYNNVVYLYDYNDVRLDIRAKQNTFSRILRELKDKKGEQVILIPMAGDNYVLSIDSLMKLYNVSAEELPVILINENIKINDVESVEEIEKYLS